jgi:hypothetical protein
MFVVFFDMSYVMYSDQHEYSDNLLPENRTVVRLCGQLLGSECRLRIYTINVGSTWSIKSQGHELAAATYRPLLGSKVS